jgi:hypothetical protein
MNQPTAKQCVTVALFVVLTGWAGRTSAQIADDQTSHQPQQLPCHRLPMPCRRPVPVSKNKFQDFVPERPSVGVMIGPSATNHSTHGGIDRSVTIELPRWSEEGSARRIRIDFGTERWLFDDYFVKAGSGDSPTDTVKLTRVNVTFLRVRRALTDWRFGAYAGWGVGRYFYAFRHAAPSRARHFGVHGVGGLEYISANKRLGINGELQLRAVGTPDIEPFLFTGSAHTKMLSTLQASIGLKIRL